LLFIGQVGARYEQEADQVAQQVMRMPDPAVPAIALISIAYSSKFC
jgi:hypothetical protein